MGQYKVLVPISRRINLDILHSRLLWFEVYREAPPIPQQYVSEIR